MEVVVTTCAIGRVKLQTNHHHQQTDIQFFLQAGCPSCRPTNSVKALKGSISSHRDLKILYEISSSSLKRHKRITM